jgi:ribonucleoside-diphosphate reductase alpha chain
MFDYLGSQTLHERYLVRDTNGGGNILEEIQSFWMRVAMGLALNEKDDVRGYENGVKIDKNNIRTEKAIEFYNVMSKHLFVPSSPTLFHAGTNHPQLSSCYLNDVGDSLESIFKVYADNAQLSRWAGGIGTSWSMLRANGSLVKKTGIKSNGIVPFLKIANDVTVAINRSGRRRGATVAYLDNWHADIEEFLDLRKNTGDDRRRTHDMNTALWISDLFMKRVKSDGDWFLFSPDETPTLLETYGQKFEEEYLKFEQQAKLGQIKICKQYKAKDIWKKMITSLYETGHPWITFKDPSNIRSPQDHVGIVRHSNLCTEITLNSSLEETAVCNLGSINYETHIVNGKFDKDLVSSTVSTAMRMLDNVIDINFYPTKEAEYSNMRHRPVGLGVMGFHDALYKLDISFDSEEAVKFSDESMEIISYYAILGSSLLAKEKGVYETYKGSKWDRNILPIDTIEMLEKERGEVINVNKSSTMDWSILREHIKNFGMRNSNCMAIAPTATISNIIGSVPCIEPIYKNIYVKSNLNGEFIIVNPYLVKDLKDRNLWDYEMLGQLKYNDGSIKNIPSIPHELKNKYKEVFEIDARHLVKVAAYRQKWIDQAQSFNLFYSGTSGKELSDIYIYAWEMGLKTTYYLRTLGASQVEKSTVNTSEFGSTHKRQIPTTQESVETKPEIVDMPKSSVIYNIKKAPEATCDGCQ